MRAFQMVEWGRPPQFVDAPIPEPGPGEIRVRVAACGLCHSDLGVMSYRPGASDNVIPAPSLPLPFTLGHETAGWVDLVGPDVHRFSEGDAVALSGVHSCGECDACIAGRDNYCWITQSFQTRGIGRDGGLAEYVIAPAREAVRLTGIDPRVAPPLTDAGVTAYAAVKRALGVLTPGSSAVVIGIGGLGSFAIQHLRAMTAARVIAVDVREEQLELATALGAHAVISSSPESAEPIRDGGTGAAAVLDFVGTDTTLGIALASVAPMGKVVVAGMGGGAAHVGWGAIAPGVEVVLSLGSTLGDLGDVIRLAEQGSLRIDSERFPFDNVPAAYAALRDSRIRSRAVVDIASPDPYHPRRP